MKYILKFLDISFFYFTNGVFFNIKILFSQKTIIIEI